MSVAEAARSVERPPASVRRWARMGVVDSQKSGGVWLVKLSDVHEVAQNGVPTGRIATLSNNIEDTLLQAWGRLHQDIMRDQLPDIIDHQDFNFFIEKEVEGIATKLRGGNYEPGIVNRIEMPKDIIRSRPLSVLSIEDRLVYEAAVQSIASSIDSQLSDSVFSHRLLKKPTPKKFIRYFGTAFGEFESYLPSDDFEGVCLKTDLVSFYEYIDYNKLLDYIDAGDENAPAINILRRLLRDWANQSSVIGLPQGSNASGILANAYLLSTDSAAISHSSGYARFSDDMRIFFLTEEEARRFAPQLVNSLRSVGLNLAPTKTEIVSVEKLKSDKGAARRSAAAYNAESLFMLSSIDELREIFDKSVSDPKNVDMTDFRFSVWRLGLLEDEYPLKKIANLLPVVPHAAEIISDYYLRLGYHQYVADAVYRYILSNDNVHPWAEIHLLRLVGRFDSVPEPLLSRLRSLAELEIGLLGDFAARVLGSVGTPHDFIRLKLIACRDDMPSARRRAALVGAVDLNANDISWVKPLAHNTQPKNLSRTANFLLEENPVPQTLVERKTPAWAPLLKEFARESGAITIHANE